MYDSTVCLRQGALFLAKKMPVNEHGANRSKKSGDFENKEQTARKRLKFENKAQTARKELGNLRTGSKPLERESRILEHGGNCSKGTREFENKAQTARQGLGHLRTRSKPFEKDWSI